MHPTTVGAEASVSVVSLLGLDPVCVPEHLLLGNRCSAGEQVVPSDKIRMCGKLKSVDLPTSACVSGCAAARSSCGYTRCSSL